MSENVNSRVNTGSMLPLYSFACCESLRNKKVRQFGTYNGNLIEKSCPKLKHGSSCDSLEDYDEEGFRPKKFPRLCPRENPDLKPENILESAEEEASSDSSVIDNSIELSNTASVSGSEEESDVPSEFDDIITEAWEKAREKGLMKYDITECRTKVAEGEYSFILQLNMGRAVKKRQTEYRIDKVVQEFDNSKFNFTKIKMDECLMQFDPSQEDEGTYIEDGEPLRSSSNVLLVNVSPIEYGHILLIPRYLRKLPQLISPLTLYTALQMAVASANRHFRIGFNSLGAYGSVNHLHFQAYYMYHAFPIERSPTRTLFEGVSKVSEVVNYPVKAFCVEVENSLRELANVVGNICEFLQNEGQPYNLLICDGGARIFLIPNAFSQRAAEKKISDDVLSTGVNPAAFELSGHIVLKREEDYDCIDEDLITRMLSPASVNDSVYQRIKAKFREILES